MSSPHTPRCRFRPQPNLPVAVREQIFIFVSKAKQAIGCLVVERVEQAFRVVGEQGDECSTQPEPAVMGISRIWVRRHRHCVQRCHALTRSHAHTRVCGV